MRLTALSCNMLVACMQIVALHSLDCCACMLLDAVHLNRWRGHARKLWERFGIVRRTRGVDSFGFGCVGMCLRNLLVRIIIVCARDIVDGIGAGCDCGQIGMQYARD